MRAKPPLQIPGSSIREPEKPGGKKCPHCKRTFKKAKIEKIGNRTRLKCPYCGKYLRRPRK